MNTDNLTTYLNDHLAGSVAALELVDHLIETCAGTTLEVEFTYLKNEIEADQALLKDLLEDYSEGESMVKKAGAWIAEKVLRTKMRVTDAAEGDLGMLEALEVLALGIEGKCGLWRALAVAGKGQPTFGLDLALLQTRAKEQYEKVEALRLQAARRAFA